MPDVTIWMDVVSEPSNRKIVSATLEFLDKLERLSYRHGKTSIEVSQAIEVESQMITFAMRSFSPFYEIFNNKIQMLVEAGICPHRLKRYNNWKKTRNKRFDEEIPPLVLSMDDLGVGFEVCLIPLALSLLVFVFEIVWPKVKQILTEYLTALFLVLTFVTASRPGI